MHFRLSHLLVLALALATPSTVSAALFPENSQVKMLDQRGLNRVLKENVTSMVAFVAPWCGHCQRMVPEYSKAAQNLHPLVKMYAIDCDEDKNKRLCAKYGVRGFPTVKLFPRGHLMDPVEFNTPQRTASQLYYFAKEGIPKVSRKINELEEIDRVVNAKQIIKKPRAMLVIKSNKMPIMWSALANKYREHIVFFSHRDKDVKSTVKLGFDTGGDGQSKVLIYASGSTKPLQFKGLLKFDSLCKFLDSLIDGSADMAELNQAMSREEPEIKQRLKKTGKEKTGRQEKEDVITEMVKEKKAIEEEKTKAEETKVNMLLAGEADQVVLNTTPTTASATVTETAQEESETRGEQEPLRSTASSAEGNMPDHIDAAETIQPREVVEEPSVHLREETGTAEPKPQINVEQPPAETANKDSTSEHIKDEL